MEEEQPEVEECRGDGLAVDQHVPLGQVPAARTHQQRRGLLVEAIDAAVRVVERDGAVDGVDQVDLTLDHVLPGRRVGVLEVGHVDVRARVEGVDEHLALGRPGQLHPALLEVGRGDGRDAPVARSHGGGFRRKVRQLARVEAGLAFVPRLKQRLTRGVELAVKPRHEFECRRGQHLVEARQSGTATSTRRRRKSSPIDGRSFPAPRTRLAAHGTVTQVNGCNMQSVAVIGAIVLSAIPRLFTASRASA